MPMDKLIKMQVLIVASTCLFVTLLSPGASAHSLPDSGAYGDDLQDQLSSNGSSMMLIAVGVALLLCGVLIIFGCAEFCKKEIGFKDFENEDSFNQEPVTPQATPSEFTMYPPVENTPEGATSAPVYFEPLPDVATQLKQKQQHLVNSAQLRPKVLQESRSRASSEDSIEEAIQRDSAQEKMKLQSLLTNTRNQLPRSQLQYIKELGNGWFGKVLQGEGHNILPGHKKTKLVIQMLKEEAVAHEQLAFLQEGTPYRDVDHPNVLKLLGQCVESPPYLTVLELCPFSDVKTYLRSHRIAMESFNEKKLLIKFACDMAAGLQALHQQGYIHRDFATRNCLLASDLSVKVGDYGLSEEVFKEDYYFDENGDALPIRWLAPEVVCVGDGDGTVLLKYITKESNIWSYGVSLWEITQFGSLPYSDLGNDHVLRLVIREKSIKLPKPDVPLTHLDRLYQLMSLCWSEPHLRPSLRELRIMLLHLLAQKDDVDTTAFDQKWSQLMPRQPAQITQVPDPTAPATVSNGSVHRDGSPQDPAARPQGFLQAGFGEVEVQATRGEARLQDEIAQVHVPDSSAVPPEKVTSPVNELSFDAEFSAANMASLNDKSSDALLNNNLSLDQEFAVAQTSKTESADNEYSIVQSEGIAEEQHSQPEAEQAEAVAHTEFAKEEEEGDKNGDITADSGSDIVIIDHEIESGQEQIEDEGEDQQNLQQSESREDSSRELSLGDPPADTGEISAVGLGDQSGDQSSTAAVCSLDLGLNESAAENSEALDQADFMTSTPKKDSVEDDTSDMFISAIQENTGTTDSVFQSTTTSVTQSTSESLSQSTSVSSSASHYQTAESKLPGHQSNPSFDLSLSYEERSIMGEDKFAAILQTVPMLSFDGEDPDQSLGGKSADDEVFDASKLTTVDLEEGAGDATLTESGQGRNPAESEEASDGDKPAENLAVAAEEESKDSNDAGKEAEQKIDENEKTEATEEKATHQNDDESKTDDNTPDKEQTGDMS